MVSTPPNSEHLKIETLRLFQDYHQEHQKSREESSLSLRDRIVRLNLGLVKKEAYYWSNQCTEQFDDLVQVGCLGMIRAIERFDYTKGNAFSSFALPYIRGEIQHYLRDKSTSVRIPRRWLELQKQANDATKELRQKLHRQPTDQEIADNLSISVREWQQVKLAHQNREPLSLDMCVGDEEDGKTSLGDLVPDQNYQSFELAQEDKIRLENALASLEDKTRHILEFVFLHDLTQKEAADRLGISVVTVSRRVKKGLEKLQTVMNQEIF